jgi:hypothetical protein
VIWLGARIAESEGGKWLRVDKETKRFDVAPAYDADLDLDMPNRMPISLGESVGYEGLPEIYSTDSLRVVLYIGSCF